MFKGWWALSADGARLCLEAHHVVGLRLLRIAAGGTGAQAEATRMVTEKAEAFAEAAATLATGGSAQKILRRYRTRVRANARRLTHR
jgi:hypothetical protein